MARSLGRKSLSVCEGKSAHPGRNLGVKQALGYLLLLAAVMFCYQFSLTQAWAQVEQGSITGTVTDPSGAAVPDATVTATNTATRVSAVTRTNSLGYYSLPYLPVGNYDVKAEKAGFKVGNVTGVPMTVNVTATVNISLQVGAAHEQVTVTAAPAVLQQQQSSLGQVTNDTDLLQLPISSRDPYALILVSPGVIPDTTTNTPIVNGGRDNTDNIQLDGAYTINSTTGDATYVPPIESVQQVTFLTSNFSAEYGYSGGAQTIGVTKSGTNQFHGSAYEFVQNNDLNANSWTSNSHNVPLGPVHYNLFGGSIGGPIWIPHVYNGKDHSFFFFNADYTRSVSPDVLTATIPTPTQLNGDFSSTTTSGGAPITIYDPNTTAPDPNNPGNYIRTAFSGNQIPAARMQSAFTQAIIPYWPTNPTNSVVNNYSQSNSRKSPTDRYFYRVDQNFGTSNRLYFRHGINTTPTAEAPWGNIAFPGTGINAEGASITSRQQDALLSDTETFRPNLLGEFKASFNRSHIAAVPPSQGFDPTTLGLPAVLNTTQNPSRFPEIDITDLTNSIGEGPSLGPARASYQVDNENNADLGAAFTWIKGAHTVKSGWDLLVTQFNVNRPDWPSGNFNFNRNYTQGPNPAVSSSTSGDGIATFLLGVPTSANVNVNRALSAQQKNWGLYVQDDWKVRRNLTLNLGLRYDYEEPWTERHNQLAVFNPAATDPITGHLGVLTFVGTPSAPAGRYDAIPQKVNFQPRIGLAYTFAKNTVFRAAYGWFFFQGSGGIGAGAGDLGNGFQVGTGMFLGPPNPAPNTPPVGATILDSFSGGILYPPSTGVGGGIGDPFPEWTIPHLAQWNASIQHVFARDWRVQVAYVGNRGEHIWDNLAQDVIDPATYLPLTTTLDTTVPNPYYGIITSGSLSSPTVGYAQPLLPYPQYTGVSSTRASIGNSWYQSAQFTIDHPVGHGLYLQAGYTIAKLIDTAPERFVSRGFNIVDPLDLNKSKTISDRDRSQVLDFALVYQLPFGTGQQWLHSGIASQLLGNWQVSTIPTFTTGYPLVISSPCHTGLPSIGCYANRSGTPSNSGVGTLAQWFDTGIFAPADPYSMGTGSRTEPNLRAPGINTWNIMLSRTQVIKERLRVQLRAEFYNAWNHPYFSAPDSGVADANFGQITSAAIGGRSIQMALRLSF